MKVMNPVLPGFNPDPSLVRVGDDYYIATSTFEWFPGICIHHSKDLVNWEILSYALTDETKFDIKGMDTACGIWAPNLTYDLLIYFMSFKNSLDHLLLRNFLSACFDHDNFLSGRSYSQGHFRYLSLGRSRVDNKLTINKTYLGETPP